MLLSCSDQANLAYGYFLYSDEWYVIEADKYGELHADWLDPEDISRSIHRKLLTADGMSDVEYEEIKHSEERVLMKRTGIGIDLFGHWERSGSAYFLHAGTVQVAYTQQACAVAMDKPKDADERLAWALSALSITPNQESAQWMIYPKYI